MDERRKVPYGCPRCGVKGTAEVCAVHLAVLVHGGAVAMCDDCRMRGDHQRLTVGDPT